MAAAAVVITPAPAPSSAIDGNIDPRPRTELHTHTVPAALQELHRRSSSNSSNNTVGESQAATRLPALNTETDGSMSMIEATTPQRQRRQRQSGIGFEGDNNEGKQQQDDIHHGQASTDTVVVNGHNEGTPIINNNNNKQLSSSSILNHPPVRPGITPLSAGRRRMTAGAAATTVKHAMMFDEALPTSIKPASTSSIIKSYASTSYFSSTSRASRSSTGSVVRAIDFAYPAAAGSFGGRSRGRSSMSVTSVDGDGSSSSYSVASTSAGNVRRHRHRHGHGHHHHHDHHPQPGLSRSSSSASATSASAASTSTSTSSSFCCNYNDGISSSSSTRSSSISSSSSSSSSLACQFRDWALNVNAADTMDSPSLADLNMDDLHHNDEHKLRQRSPSSAAHVDNSSVNAKKASRQQQLPFCLSCSPESLSTHEMSPGEIFSPMTDVPPLPASVFPPGISDELELDDDDIEDVDGIVCFQPGCNTTISPGTYYCQKHDDPFGDDS